MKSVAYIRKSAQPKTVYWTESRITPSVWFDQKSSSSQGVEEVWDENTEDDGIRNCRKACKNSSSKIPIVLVWAT